jgi:hypothetical protein
MGLDRRPDQLTEYVEWARQELTRPTSIDGRNSQDLWIGGSRDLLIAS